MCIRDRFELGKAITVRQGRDVTLIATGGMLCNAIGAASTPVSYTHLRAHETVLDLVCRLLLEKKKK